MKVEAEPHGSAPPKQASESDRFQRALSEATARRATTPKVPLSNLGRAPTSAPRPVPTTLRTTGPTLARATTTVLATARGALSSPESLAGTRQAMHAESHRLGHVRGEAQTLGQERTEHRLADLLVRELARAPRGPALMNGDPRKDAAPPPSEPLRPSHPTEGPGTEPRATAATAGPSGSEPAPTSRVDSTRELIERIEVFVKSQRPALSLSIKGSLDATVEVERTGPREVALRLQGHQGPVSTEAVARLRDALESRGLRLRALHAG